MNEDKTKTTKSYDTIKLGIDAHAKWYYVAQQLDGATPKLVQKMTIDALLRFVAKQQDLAGEVHPCYEAGAFGYHLHRKLEAPRRHLVADPPLPRQFASPTLPSQRPWRASLRASVSMGRWLL